MPGTGGVGRTWVLLAGVLLVGRSLLAECPSSLDFDQIRTNLNAQGQDLAFVKIGFHTGPGGNKTGLGEWMQCLDDAGVPFFLKSVDSAGEILEGALLRAASGVPHVLVYRKSVAGDWNPDVPDYHLAPSNAAALHWQRHRDAFPPELVPYRHLIWVETVNEIDKNRAEWLGEFACETARLAMLEGYNWAAFGWSSGEPEREHWEGPRMQQFLRLAGDNPGRVAVALHEYSFVRDNLDRMYPDLVGRFQALFDVCASNAIPRPTVLVTEFGWVYDNIAATMDQALQVDLPWAADLYAKFPEVLGAAIWYLGPGFGGVADRTQPLIAPLTEYASRNYFAVPLQAGETNDPTAQPTTVLEEYFVASEGDWYDQGVQQVRNGWSLWYATGTNPLGNPTGAEPWNDWAIPEAIFRWDAFLPPAEHAILLNEYGYAYKVFAGNRAWHIKLASPVLDLTSGVYRVGLKYYSDTYTWSGVKVAPGNALAFESKLNLGDREGEWSGSTHLADNVVSNTFVLPADTNCAVSFELRGRWALDNVGAFVKSFILERVGDATAISPQPFAGNLVTNGAFAAGLDGWTVWTQRGALGAVVTNGRAAVTGINHNGGLYQQFETGGAGTEIWVAGWWASEPTVERSQWGEVLVINGNRLPRDGEDVVAADSDVVMLFKNDTWAALSGWSGAMRDTAPVARVERFVAEGDRATLILKVGSIAGGLTGTTFDDLLVRGPASDCDGDGLPDMWEQGAFGHTARDGTDNYDLDPHTDAQEWVAGTDPTNAASYLRVVQTTLADGAPGVVLTWDSVTGRTYTVYRSASWPVSTWTSLLETAGSGTRRAYTNQSPPLGPRLLRLGVDLSAR